MNITNPRIAAIISGSATPASDICDLPVESITKSDWAEIVAHFAYAGGGIMQIASREQVAVGSAEG